MNTGFSFRSYISRFGVEFSIVFLMTLGWLYFFKPQIFVIEKREAPVSQEALATLGKIKSAVEKAEVAEKAFLKNHNEADLNVYNEQMMILNHQMGQLLRTVNVDTVRHKQITQLNKALKEHFDSVNAAMSRKAGGKAERRPANTTILPMIENALVVKAKPYFELKKEMLWGIFTFLGLIVILSRILHNQAFKAQSFELRNLKNRSILLDTILNSMGEALIVVDKNGYFTHYNAAAQRIIGTKLKEVAVDSSVAELGFFDIKSGDLYTRRRLPFHRSLHGDKVDDQEIFVQNSTHPEGVYISLSSRPLNDIAGDIFGAMVVFKDISRRKMVEQEWQRAREAAVEASLKKSDFLAAISHEIRTPMNGVIGMTTLLADTPLNSEQKEYVGTVKRSAESLLMLINDILDYSKIEAGKVRLDPQPFDLEFLAQDVLEIFRPTVLEKNVDLHLVLKGPAPWYFRGDSGRVRQILVNLIGNAVKFTEKGSVTLEISKTIESETQAGLKFEIKDTGPGLKEDERRSLFQKYFQTKTGMKVGGTGLGLSISKQLVDLMGGEIGVESVVGLGSTFWFKMSLPLVNASEVPRSHDVKFSKMFTGTVLVVEDQIVNQRVAQSYLRKLGLEVELAGNGLVAYEKCLSQRFDLIFMDCQMPVLDGFEATRRIRKDEKRFGRRTPIVALTADAASNDKNGYLEAGMDEYLAKPLELGALVDVLFRRLKPSEEALDVAALAQLETYVVKNRNLVETLIEDYSKTAPDLIASMRAALHVLDMKVITESAHALKSTSATLGAKKLAQLCADIEKAKGFTEVGALLVQVEEQFVLSMQDLKKYSENKKVA